MLNPTSVIAPSSQKMRYLTGVAEPSTAFAAGVGATSLPPIIPASTATTANFAKTEMSELFDGDIWVIPYTHSYDFSVIATPQSYSFTVFNSSKSSVTLNALFSTNAAGTSIEGEDIPFTFPANSERTFTIKTTIEGDRVLDGYYTFVFTTQTIIFSITGTRAVVLTILPSANYAESETYQTDIFSAQDGTELRNAIVSTARRSVEYDVIPSSNQKIETIEEILAYALRFYCMQPLWFSYTQVTTAQNAYTILCDTTSRDFKIGDYALIRKDFDDYVMQKITAFNDTSITFLAQVSVSPGDVIVPLIAVTPDSSNAFKFYNSDTAAFSLKFKELL